MTPPVNTSLSTPLSRLRDIHLPAPVSWWPPAPGWWLLLIGALLLCIGLAWRHRRGRKDRWRRHALQELARLRELHDSRQSSAQTSVRALSVLLRRVAVSRFPRNDVAALNGEAWLAFLDRTLGAGPTFMSAGFMSAGLMSAGLMSAGLMSAGLMSDIGRLLAVAPYLPHADIDADALRSLFAVSERWFKTLPTRAQP